MWDLFPCPEIEHKTSPLPVQSAGCREVPRGFVCLFCFEEGVFCVCVCVCVCVFSKSRKKKGEGIV